ncbi:MAG TPA: glycosyltransferase family 4 protein [Acidimicrobiales bacterium]|nr:glycosyltransferase family 4 protein [Acidimicrobiales bacterium]
MKRAGKLAFVPPRYGADVVGGAETVLREMATGLAARGWDVEVLTTCARDHFSWANEYPAGVEEVDGIAVRRFPTVVPASRQERAEHEAGIHGGRHLSLAEQQRWVNADLRVPELFHHLLDTVGEYRAIVLGPYLFWTTFAGWQLAPAKTILLPCAHDEPYVRLELFRPMFAGVAGLLFHTEPEHELAHSVVPEGLAPHAVVGSGMHVPAGYDPERVRAKYGIDGRFLLYAGRREGAKGWEQLVDAFVRATARHRLPFSLVTIGSGEVRPAPGVRDLGFVPEEDRNDLFAAADAYVQPSVYESFSRTIMEAWLAGTLVIGNAGSPVVAWHCERSGAGLTYEDDAELQQCLLFLAGAPETAARLAAGGRSYVIETYAFDAVMDRVEDCLERWTVAP